jgi:hypothetical protein
MMNTEDWEKHTRDGYDLYLLKPKQAKFSGEFWVTVGGIFVMLCFAAAVYLA